MRVRGGVAAAALAVWLLAAGTAAAASVVSGITVGGDERSLEVDVAASGPLGYLLRESPAPFTLTLLFADASFGFPDERRSFAGQGLAELRAATLTRDGKSLARLDLTFIRGARYSVDRRGPHLLIRADVPGPRPPVVIGRPSRRGSTGSADGHAPELRAVRPESGARSARVLLEIDGAPAVNAFALGHPARIVVDLDHARFPAEERVIPVDGGLLRRVRVSQHAPGAVRVVCDLREPRPFRVEPAPGGLVVRVGEGVR